MLPTTFNHLAICRVGAKNCIVSHEFFNVIKNINKLNASSKKLCFRFIALIIKYICTYICMYAHDYMYIQVVIYLCYFLLFLDALCTHIDVSI